MGVGRSGDVKVVSGTPTNADEDQNIFLYTSMGRCKPISNKWKEKSFSSLAIYEDVNNQGTVYMRRMKVSFDNMIKCLRTNTITNTLVQSGSVR